ncbi:MAG: type II toxin-antitoxin system RelE/ParE family toxin [Nitrospira sp.]|nr:type II toxin-antitoxin system RelE/ParE family toxin [Nitrospira sp.]
MKRACKDVLTIHVFDSICIVCHTPQVKRWDVEIAREFQPEFDEFPEDVQDEILAHARLIEEFGPELGRPRADTLKGSRHANMKELRFHAADGVWRVAFAFDPRRHAILLVAGDKSGGSERRFYEELIRKADKRLDAHLGRLKQGRKQL